MKKVILKPISILLSICVIFSTICGSLLAQATTYYSYKQTYDNSDVFSTANQHLGFSVVGGKLSTNSTPDASVGYRVTLNPAQSVALTVGKTYRIGFDFTSSTNFNLTNKTPFYPSSVTNTYSCSATAYSVNPYKDGTTGNGRYYATFTATEKYLVFRYYSGVYVDITIDNLTIDEVIPTVKATSEDESKGTATVGNKNSAVSNFISGDTAVFNATAKAGYTFEGWYNGTTKVEGAGATYETTVTDILELTAKFKSSSTQQSYYDIASNYSCYAANNTLGGTAGGTAPTVDSTIAHTTGGSSIKFTNMHGKVAAFKLNGIEVGKTYALSLWFTGTPTTTRNPASYDFYTPGIYSNGGVIGTNGDLANTTKVIAGSTVGSIKDTDWRQFNIEFTANSADLFFAVRGWCCNSLWLDDVTLTEVSRIEVSFNTDGGSSIDKLLGKAGDPLTLPKPPTKNGYSFAGWFTNAELTTKFTGTTFPDASITLYAKWKEGIHQEFEYYNLLTSGKSGIEVTTESGTDNKVMQVNNNLGTSQSHFQIADISSYLSDGDIFAVSFDYKSTVAASFVLRRCQRTNTWTNDTFQNEKNTKKMNYDLALSNTNGIWKKYTAYFYFTTPSSDLPMLAMSVDDNGSAIQIDNVTVEKLNKTIITLNANNNTTATTIFGGVGRPLTLTEPEVSPEGKYFDGWYSDSAFTTRFTDTVFPSSNIELFAKWTNAVEQNFENYNLTCLLSDGFIIYNKTDSNDTNVYEGNKSLHRDLTAKPTGAARIILNSTKLKKNKIYKLTFKLNLKGIENSPSSIALRQFETQRVWGTVENGDMLFYHDTQLQNGWIDATYYFVAKYEYVGLESAAGFEYFIDNVVISETTKSKITFNSNGGSDITELEGIAGAPVISLPQPATAPEGLRFSGWYYDKALTNHAVITEFPGADITLYAKWVSKTEFTQPFEDYHHALNSDSGWSVYTAANSDDDNVCEGSKSIYRDGSLVGTKPIFLNDRYSKLNVGSAYKMTLKIKATTMGDKVPYSLAFINPPQSSNIWSYTFDTKKYFQAIDFFHKSDIDIGWQEIEFYFVAEAESFGLVNAGDFSFYIDEVKIKEVPIVTVSFETNGGSEIADKKGAAGSKLTVENPTAPEGKTFAGWYTDSEFLNSYTISVFPESDLVLYAKYIDAGTFEQDFEHWNYPQNSNGMTEAFSLYTASDKNDTNVYSGKHSLLYNNLESTKTYAFTVFDETMGTLQLGEKYKLTMRFKPVETKTAAYADGPYLRVYNTTTRSNSWSSIKDEKQGPLVNYKAYIFYHDEFDNTHYSGTSNAFKSTEKKDKNGWITMEFEFVAKQPFVSIYTTGLYKAYFDAINIEPLPSGVIEKDYSNPYCEDFYNIIPDAKESLNGTKKQISELMLDSRGDYVFTASLKKGSSGTPKVYLSWDKEGKDIIEGTVFEGTTDAYKLYSSRVITNLSGVVYLVTEGGGKDSCNLISLFKTQFGKETDPNPIYTFVKVDYDKLPEKSQKDTVDKDENIIENNDLVSSDDVEAEEPTEQTETTDSTSPQTSDSLPIIPCILILVAALCVILALGKRGFANEQ